MATLVLSAGDRTESLAQFVTTQLDDATLDRLEIDREVASQAGLASEPVTIAVSIALGTVAISAITRLIERWMENQHQLHLLQIVADAETEEERRQLASLSAKFSNVSLAYGNAKPSWEMKG